VRYKDLRDLILAGEFHHGLRDIAATKSACFDLETPREAKMLFYGLSFLGRQSRQFGSLVHEKRGAFSSGPPTLPPKVLKALCGLFPEFQTSASKASFCRYSKTLP